jgi:hypothetical protein
LDHGKNLHARWHEDGVYRNLKKELWLVLANGFILWILGIGIGYLTGFWKMANPLLIIPYGIIPWWTLLFIGELKRQR